MPLVPCAPNVNCLSAESPTTPNLTSEGPDIAKCFRYAFSPSSTHVCEFDLTFCQQLTAIGGDVAIFCDYDFRLDNNPPPPVIYSSNAQSCTVDCGGFSESYEVAPGTFVGLSQAEADARAHAFACQLAAMQCTGSFTVYTSSAQSCTVVCPDQTTYTFLLPAGLFSALSQSEANFSAYLFSCEVAALLCSGLPPLAIQQSAGVPPPVPAEPLWANFAQSCSSACQNGSIFSYTIPGGTYLRESRQAANSVAFSAACRLAALKRACLSDLPPSACVDEFFGEFMEATGLSAPVSFSVGALPPGLTLSSDGFLQGVPSTAGDYSFILRATGSDGSYAQRTYSITVIEITPALLPDGTVNAPYAEALSASGMSSPTWSVTDGSLPPGVTLSPFTGVLSGTPTTPGTFVFTVSATE